MKLSQVLLAHEDVISHALRNEVMSAQADQRVARDNTALEPSVRDYIVGMHSDRERRAQAALDAIDKAEEEF